MLRWTSLLMKPLRGGTPTRANSEIVSVKAVIGMPPTLTYK